MAGLCVAAVVLSGCGSDATGGGGGSDDAAGGTTNLKIPPSEIPKALADKKPILIGAAIAFTGLEAPYDLPSAVTAGLAVNDINRKGGVLGRPLKIVSADNRSDRSAGGRAALQLAGDGVEVGLASCDLDYGAPDSLAYAKKGIASMSLCAGTPTYGPQRVSDLAFSAGVATNNEAAAGAAWAVKSKGWKRGYLLTDTSITYTQSWAGYFEDAFAHYGGSIVGEDTMQSSDASFQTQVTRIANMDDAPDFISACSVPPGGPTLVRQLRAAGVDLPIVSCVGMAGERWLKAVPGLKDFFVTDFANYRGESSDDAINDLHDRYIEVTKQAPPTGQFIEGYGAVELLAKAIEKAGSTKGSAVRDALETFEDVDVLSGPTTYTNEWHVPMTRSLTIQDIVDGKPTEVEQVTPDYVPEP